MRRFTLLIPVLLILSSCIPAHAADCGKALFGWTTKDGYRIAGVLANEGVGGKNRRGYQNLKSDGGNFRNGKNCGGTAYGITCRDHPGFNPKTAAPEDAVRIYENEEWKHIGGTKWKSQYGAYKIMDLATNLGKEETCIIVRTFIDAHNGKAKDVYINGKPLTDAEIDWLNDYTRSDVIPPGYQPKYSGDFQPGGHDNTRRENFLANIALLAQKRYTHITRTNKKLRVWTQTWSDRNLQDMYRNVHRSLD